MERWNKHKGERSPEPPGLMYRGIACRCHDTLEKWIEWKPLKLTEEQQLLC